MSEPFLYLSSREAESLLSPGEAVELAELALQRQAAGKVTWSSPRLLTVAPGQSSRRYVAKACVLDERYAGFRAASVDREHPAAEGSGGAPRQLSLLCDAASGRFLAVIDEEWQHAMRTGAGAAVAAKHCAPPGPQVVAMIGAGRVAGPTVQALREVFGGCEVRVSSRRADSAQALAASIGRGVRAASLEEALERATVVITATTSKEPLIAAGQLAPGAFVYAMGDGQELATDVYRSADVLMADDWDQCQTRTDIVRLLAEGVIDPERVISLWEVVAKVRSARSRDSDVVVMRSQGLVTQDVAIAAHVYEAAVRRGSGVRLG